MSDKHDGGPAFHSVTIRESNNEYIPNAKIYHKGMSLRDYFAGQALITLVGVYPNKEAAKYSYEQADAMLKAREQ